MALYELSNLKFYTPTWNVGGIKVNVLLTKREEWGYCHLLFQHRDDTVCRQEGYGAYKLLSFLVSGAGENYCHLSTDLSIIIKSCNHCLKIF